MDIVFDLNRTYLQSNLHSEAADAQTEEDKKIHRIL